MIILKLIFDFIIYLIFLIFISIFKILPSKIKLKLSEFLGLLLYYLIPKGRKLSLRNLNLILNEQYRYNLTEKQIKDIAIKSYKNTMKSFLLPFWIYEYGEKYPPIIHNLELLEKLKETNDRIILATLHYGFFHMSMYPIIDEPMFIIVRPVPNKFIEAYMNKIRFKKNMLSFTEQNIKALFKHKKSKGFFIMLNDVRKPDGEKVTFFNLPTTASGFTAFYSIRENLPIIVIHSEVDSNNICNIYINEIIYPENYTDKNDLTDKLLKVYEKIILNNPEQWYWFQDRWINKK